MNVLPLGALGPALGAAIVRTDRRIVRDLRSANATSANRAIVLGGLRLRRLRTGRLTSAGALRATADGRHWLDEAGWRAYRAARRRRVLIAVTLALLAMALGIWLTSSRA